MATPTDPAAFFREMVGEWEKLANSLGNDAMRREEFARGMQGAGSAALAMQSALREATDKALAAANIPSRDDVDALAQRLSGIEAALLRIEARLPPPQGGAIAPAAKPAPRRTRTAPARTS